jgi:hypothetical protein
MQISRNNFILWLVSAALIVAPLVLFDGKASAEPAETRYLLFQIFTRGNVENDAWHNFPPQGQIASVLDDISTKIGVVGDSKNKLGFCLGPISFDNSDAEVRTMIAQGFDLARKKNMAVAFHIDDHIFWEKRGDLIHDKANIEWIDFDGKPCTGRRLDWGPKPTKVAPQMCFNSPAIKKAVDKRASLIGTEIKHQLDRLKAEKREDLFAGIITGWETMIGPDYATNHYTGYHALKNIGMASGPSDLLLDRELVKIVKVYIETWAGGLEQAGIPGNKIYCHLAFTPQGLASVHGLTYPQQVGFAIPSDAFSSYYRTGYSTYPSEGTFDQLHNELSRRGSPPWISAEGTNVVPDGMSGEANMESYLAQMFNHGAVMVNIFSWGIGGEAERDKNMFRRVTENNEALNSYKKFLTGQTLKESPRPHGFSPIRFQAKVSKLQAMVPQWISKTHRPDLIKPKMQQLDQLIKTKEYEQAEKLADEMLKFVGL